MDSDYRNSPALRQLYRAVVGRDLRKYLRKISCPVEVVWGEHDPILPLSLTKIYAKELVDRKIRVVWGGTHDPHISQPEQTLKILQEAV
jgi:pimeloyl-ACP methyl ester carboxylesterase